MNNKIVYCTQRYTKSPYPIALRSPYYYSITQVFGRKLDTVASIA
ncbi:hypothetical protein [Porphyromonas sp. COT-290 OH860]|nr:hypothetical protein [Porphyromonas sp. COT-290 OH860]